MDSASHRRLMRLDRPGLRRAGLFLLLSAGVCLAAPHKLRVTDSALAQSLIAQGGRLVADYGSFRIIETDQAPSPELQRAGARLADDLNVIQLASTNLNTTAPATRSLSKRTGSFSGSRLHLVQFVGPVKPEWRRALEETGVRVVCYIPHDAYLVYAGAAALTQIRGLAGAGGVVQWEGAYQEDYKIHPRVLAADAGGSSLPGGSGTFAIQMVADPEANAATRRIIDQWKLAAVRKEFELLTYHNVIVPLPTAALPAIAAQPDVISIRPYVEPRKNDERQAQILAGNLAGAVPAGSGYLAWLAGKGFTQAQFDASGFVVDLSDSGIDNGTTAPGHFGLYPLGDPAHDSRIAYNRLEGKPNPGSSLAGCDGHGTLNAHIVAGYDAFSGFPFADSGGFSYGLGVCPFVKVGASVIFDPDAFTDPNFATLQTQAYNSGARISNNSWGASADGSYDLDAQTFDTLVRDVGGLARNRQMVMVFVAGNDGPGAQTIDSPGTAKNVFTVGAAENVRSLSLANGGSSSSGYDGCGAGDALADNANDVFAYSSRGPCSDGRMKPDLMAPGTHITGGVAQSGGATTNGTGSALSCFDASGLCALPGSGGTMNSANYFPLNQQLYSVSTGTSHAGPAVSGACALLRQYFINHALLPPSPAMTKAFLMNSARYLTGANANDTLWSPSQGMGELDLGMALDGVPRMLRDQSATDIFTATGQTRTFSGTIADASRPFRVTLAWTDAPGSTTAGQALVNDLDLTVTVNGATYRGNVFSGAQSVTGGAADSLNNVESVFLPAGPTNTFTVTVTGADIAADGVGDGKAFPEQDFALVIYNAASSGTTLYTPSAGVYNGLFYPASGAGLGDSGAVTLKTTAKGTFSGRLQMGTGRYGFSGRLDAYGAANAVIQRRDATPLTLLLQIDPSDNNSLVGSVSDGSWTAPLRADRAAFSARKYPAPLAGNYTIVISGGEPGDTTVPQGDGVGTVTVNASGRIRLRAILGDGTRLTQSASLSLDGRWPLYVSLRGGQGQVLGWLTFTSTQELGGAVSWMKPPRPGAKLYPGGFELAANVIGSGYVRPQTRVSPVLDFSRGVVVFSGGDLAADFTNSVVLDSNNKVYSIDDRRFRLVLNRSQGWFKGRTVDPVTGDTILFTGAILQVRNYGSGFFLGSARSGMVFFGPAP